MGYYDLSKTERSMKNQQIKDSLLLSISNNTLKDILVVFDDQDTYIRKVGYQALGKLYKNNPTLRIEILNVLENLYIEDSERIRQSVMYTCGEIAIDDFLPVEKLLVQGLVDSHHSVKNAVTGSLKIAVKKNDVVLSFCQKHILSPDPQVRKLICHGLELRGRTQPEDIIDTLKELQFDESRIVKRILIHVLGQISYKKGCFYYVSKEVASWDNRDIYEAFKIETIDVHNRYAKFSALSTSEVISYFSK